MWYSFAMRSPRALAALAGLFFSVAGPSNADPSPAPSSSPLTEIGHVTAKALCQSAERKAFTVVKAMLVNEDRVEELRHVRLRPETERDFAATLNNERTRAKIVDDFKDLDAADAQVDAMFADAHQVTDATERQKIITLARSMKDDLRLQRLSLHKIWDIADQSDMQRMVNGSEIEEEMKHAVALNPSQGGGDPMDTANRKSEALEEDAVISEKDRAQNVAEGDSRVANAVSGTIDYCRQVP